MQNTDINLKKADKGSTIVVMNKTDKIREGQIQIDDKHNSRPLSEPMVKETHSKKVLRLIRVCLYVEGRGYHVEPSTLDKKIDSPNYGSSRTVKNILMT